MTSLNSLTSRLELLEKRRFKPVRIFFWRDAHEPPYNPANLCDYWKNKIQKQCEDEEISQWPSHIICFHWMDENTDLNNRSI